MRLSRSRYPKLTSGRIRIRAMSRSEYELACAVWEQVAASTRVAPFRPKRRALWEGEPLLALARALARYERASCWFARLWQRVTDPPSTMRLDEVLDGDHQLRAVAQTIRADRPF